MLKNKKIIVVDDDPDILEAIQITFEDEECEVKTSTKGEDVYVLVKDFQPDLIILDVLLSGKDGRVICKNLKENDNTKQIPIIMISAHPNAAVSTKAVGANDFLAKPFDIYALIQKAEARLCEDMPAYSE